MLSSLRNSFNCWMACNVHVFHQNNVYLPGTAILLNMLLIVSIYPHRLPPRIIYAVVFCFHYFHILLVIVAIVENVFCHWLAKLSLSWHRSRKTVHTEISMDFRQLPPKGAAFVGDPWRKPCLFLIAQLVYKSIRTTSDHFTECRNLLPISEDAILERRTPSQCNKQSLNHIIIIIIIICSSICAKFSFFDRFRLF